MKKNFKFGMIKVVSVIADVCFLCTLGKCGYFSWVFQCYEKTLELLCGLLMELLFNMKNITCLQFGKVILSDLAVAWSGLIVLSIVFDWIPNGIMKISGYKNKIESESIGNKENR